MRECFALSNYDDETEQYLSNSFVISNNVCLQVNETIKKLYDLIGGEHPRTFFRVYIYLPERFYLVISGMLYIWNTFFNIHLEKVGYSGILFLDRSGRLWCHSKELEKLSRSRGG